MTFEHFVQYTNSRLNCASVDSSRTTGLCLSEFGEKELKKRWDKSETDGGVSDYWKTTELQDVKTKRLI
jgi:hypothetical protein